MKFLIIVFLLITYHLSLIPPAYARVDIGNFFGFGNIKSLGQGTSSLVVPTFSIAAAAVILYFIFGAFKYLTSGGNKEELEGAKRMITHAIVGFIILIFSFFVLQFLLGNLFGIKVGLFT